MQLLWRLSARTIASALTFSARFMVTLPLAPSISQSSGMTITPLTLRLGGRYNHEIQSIHLDGKMGKAKGKKV